MNTRYMTEAQPGVSSHSLLKGLPRQSKQRRARVLRFASRSKSSEGAEVMEEAPVKLLAAEHLQAIEAERHEQGMPTERQETAQPETFHGIVTCNPAMRQLFAYVKSIAQSPWPVLITGESGVGKELFARAIHTLSQRAGDFLPVNLAGLDDTMFTDTLFGHKSGAYTGARDTRKGLVETAMRGTLFLDEIGDLELNSQVKLLRLLQEKEYYALGSDVRKIAEVRVVTATNVDIDAKRTNGLMREDLYFRLCTHCIRIPALRERLDDLPFLIDHFVKKACESLKRPIPTLPQSACSVLAQYSFPGNIRELESILFDAISRYPDAIPLTHFEEYLKKSEHAVIIHRPNFFTCDEVVPLKACKEYMIRKALEKAGGNQTIAAQMLEIDQSTLSKWLQRQQRKDSRPIPAEAVEA